MKNYLKQSLSFLITFTIALSFPYKAKADEPTMMEQAQAAVAMNHEFAKDFTDQLVLEDFYQALKNLNVDIGQISNTLSKGHEFPKKMARVVDQLNQIASMNEQDVAATQENLQKTISLYEEAVRTRFDLSWIPSSTELRLDQFGPSLKSMIKYYAEICKNGRSDLRYQAKLPPQPTIPKNDFFIYLGYEGDTEGNGHYNFRYEPVNFKPENRTRSDINNSALQVGSLAGTIWGAGATGVVEASSTMLTVAATVFWVAIAIVAVISIINTREAKRKRFKMVKEMHAAEIYQLLNSKYSFDIAEMYTKQCSSNIALLSRIEERVSAIEAGGQSRKNAIAQMENERPEVEAFQNAKRKYEESYCRTTLYDMNKEGHCKDGKICQIDKGNISFMDKSCAIDESYGVSGLGNDRTIVSNFEGDKDLQVKLVKSVTYFVTDMMGPKLDSTRESFKTISQTAITTSQRGAFKKLTTALRIRQRMNTDKNEFNRALVDELRIGKTYDSSYSSFLDLLATAVKVVFGQAKKEEFETAFAEWDTDFSEFVKLYVHVPEVSSLHFAAKKLREMME